MARRCLSGIPQGHLDAMPSRVLQAIFEEVFRTPITLNEGSLSIGASNFTDDSFEVRAALFDSGNDVVALVDEIVPWNSGELAQRADRFRALLEGVRDAAAELTTGFDMVPPTLMFCFELVDTDLPSDAGAFRRALVDRDYFIDLLAPGWVSTLAKRHSIELPLDHHLGRELYRMDRYMELEAARSIAKSGSLAVVPYLVAIVDDWVRSIEDVQSDLRSDGYTLAPAECGPWVELARRLQHLLEKVNTPEHLAWLERMRDKGILG